MFVLIILHINFCSEAPPKNKNDKSSEEKAFLFGSPSISAMSFQSVAASSIENSPFGQNAKTKSKGFAGAGSTLFASQSSGGETHEEEEQEGYHKGPHFEAIISLPEKIDVKTGEEDEEVMFSHRSKLYRFVAEEKQWKERGIGDIKLLRNVTSGKMRVLMRRDQVLKLCANHQITTDMSLQPNAGSDRSWVWSTHADFSEGECKAERLAVRFKNEDIAKQFKEKFEECQEMLKNQASLKPPLQKETVNTEGVKEDLFAKFKAEEGSWECDTCMVRNGSDKLVCAACTTPKPGAQTSQMPANGGTPSFSFGTAGAPSNSGFSFGSPASSVDAGSGFASASSQGFSFGSDFSSSGTGFVFGQQKADEKSSKPVFAFGLGSTGLFSFGSTQKEENTGVRLDDVGECGNYSDDQASSNEGSDRRDDSSQTSKEGEVAGDGEEGEKRHVGLDKGLLKGWKSEKDSWECNTCLVRNKSEKLECVACASPKPGVDVNREKTTEGKPLFGFSPGSSFSSAGFSFGTSASSSGAGFSFGSGPTSTGAGFSFGFNGQSDGDGEEGDGGKKGVGKGLLKGWKPETDSWDCTTCLVRNKIDKLECVACASPKPGVDVNREKTTEGKPLFGFSPGSFSSAGFSFGTSAASSGAGFSFGSGPTSTGAGFSFGFNGQSDGDGEEGDEKQEGVGKSLLTGWKPETDSWDCTTCLVRNKIDKLECVACASPKPGVDVNREKTTEGKPLFGFSPGSSFSSAGFSFGTSASSSGAGFFFGSGPTSTGAGFSFGFNG